MSEKSLTLGKSDEVSYYRGINLITLGGIQTILMSVFPLMAFLSGHRDVSYAWFSLSVALFGAGLLVANQILGWNKYPVTDEEDE